MVVDHRWFSFEDLIPLPLSSGPVLEDLLSFDPRGSFLSNLEISRISPCHGDLLINNRTRVFLSVIKIPRFFETEDAPRECEGTLANKAKVELLYFTDFRHEVGPADAGSHTVHIYNNSRQCCG